MNANQRQDILEKAKKFFRDTIAKNHVKNTKKLKKLKEFNVNPFLVSYLANFLTGNNKPESIAKALIYPRVLGTSINTSFGTNLQYFCSTVLEAYASTTTGIDIEFIDQIDGRKKYCQTKAGPNTINKDDITTIINHFSSIKNLARVNKQMNLSLQDLAVGVLYGTAEELSQHYKIINKEHPVIIGQEFWHRLTGDEKFYFHLIDSIGEIANEANGKKLLTEIINELSEEIKRES